MSSSVSLTISERHCSKSHREYPELNPLNNSEGQMFIFEQRERVEHPHHAGPPRMRNQDIRSLRAPSSFDQGKLKRWNEQQFVDQDEEGSNSEGFHLAVDDKISRNSYECPDQQAKYIERWLNDSDKPQRSKSFDDESMQFSGNVVGIRGLSPETFLGDNMRIKAEFEQLKLDHLKLQADYIELRSHLASNYGRQMQADKSVDLEMLKSIVLEQRKQLENIANQQGEISKACDRCRLTSTITGARDENFESMRFARNQFALNLAQKEQEHSANIETLQADINRSRSIITSQEAELAKLKNQVKNLSLEPNNRKLLALNSENTRLRGTNDVDKHEFFVLRENYSRLEQKLRSLVSDQESLNNEQQEGVKEVLLELCRLQVYQPKLEMILETETQIRMNLQSQLANLQEEKENLTDQVTSLKSQLDECKIRAVSRDSRDVERLREELSNWTDKYDRLKQEYSDLNELQRATKAKSIQQNVRLQNECQLARESCQQELERAKSEQRQLKTQVTSLELHLNTMRNQLDEYKSERDRLHRDLLQAHRELEEGIKTSDEQEHIRSIANKLEQSEQTISSLERELSISKCKNKDLTCELGVANNKLEHMMQQYNELKRRFDVQLKLFEEFKDKRDREVSKLRLDLNLEQYNRQVSLKGIEKELRSSLHELEAMKLRFSKRYNPAVGMNCSTVPPTRLDVSPSKPSEQTVSQIASSNR